MTNADVNVIMLLNCAEYTDPVFDSWYYAQTPLEGSSTHTDNTRFYADPPASIMGCVQQYQVCSLEPRSCSPLIGLSQLKEHVVAAEGSASDAIWTYFMRAVSNSGLDYMVGTLGSTVLQAEANVSYAQQLFSAPLPELQWQTEVLGWVQFTLSNIQRLLYQFVNGPSDPSLSSAIVPPPYRDTFDVCQAQKIRNSNYYSFSVVWLAFTLLFGLLTILLNLCLSSVVGWFQRRTRKGAYKYQQWTEDYVLQIQRLAYQNLGIGNWHGHEDTVPTTGAGEIVGRPVRPRIASTSTMALKNSVASVITNSSGSGHDSVSGYGPPTVYSPGTGYGRGAGYGAGNGYGPGSEVDPFLSEHQRRD